MIDSVEELKALILWAKKEGVRKLQVGNISVLISHSALSGGNSEPLPKNPDSSGNSERKLNPEPLDGAEVDLDNDPDLFHSAE